MAGANFDISGLFRGVETAKGNLGGDVTYRVVTNVEYAIDQEFGNSRVPAQPYLRPAAHAVKPKIPGIVASADSVEDAVREVALRCLRLAKQYCPVDTGRLRASIRVERVRGGASSTMGTFNGGIDLGSGDVSGSVSA